MRILFYLACLLMFLSSCSSPDNTANEFLDALVESDYDEARALSTDKTHTLLNLVEAASKLADQKDLEKLKNKDIKCSCEEQGEKADCSCCETGKPQDECMPLTLVKQDGQWLVDVSKESGLNFGN